MSKEKTVELNRGQVKKALECWASRNPCHEKCSILDHEEGANCIGLTTRSALSLIKKLTEESENWKAIAEGYQKQFEDCAEDRARLTEENERLETVNKALKRLYLNTHKESETVKADTVRKMQEEIKKRCIKGGIYPAFIASTVDQITKELLEGKK